MKYPYLTKFLVQQNLAFIAGNSLNVTWFRLDKFNSIIGYSYLERGKEHEGEKNYSYWLETKKLQKLLILNRTKNILE